MLLIYDHSYPALTADNKQKLIKGEPYMMFVYIIKGMNAEQKAAYKAHKNADGADYYREDKQGNPLYFTTEFNAVPNATPLKISESGSYFADTSEADMLKALIKRFGAAGRILAGNAAVQQAPVILDDEKLD